jgi:hypothetical protein
MRNAPARSFNASNSQPQAGRPIQSKTHRHAISLFQCIALREMLFRGLADNIVSKRTASPTGSGYTIKSIAPA